MRCFRPLVLSLILLFPVTGYAFEYYRVTGDDVRIRKGPGLQWKVLSTVDKKQFVLEVQRKGQWSEIYYLTSHEKVVTGWIYNRYLAPQSHMEAKSTDEKVEVTDISPGQLICPDYSSMAAGSLCYMDISFVLLSSSNYLQENVLQETEVSCKADFVVPDDRDIIPIQTTAKQVFYHAGGRVPGKMRLNVGLDARVDQGSHILSHYSCTAK